MAPRLSGNARRPNIIFIVTDDQRCDTLALVDPTTGEPWMSKTLRWFGGTRDAHGNPVSTEFTNAFPTTPLCCPSRASIMTGKYAHNHGVHGNFDKDNLDQTTTLQHYLKSQPSPYHTGVFGKYLNNWVSSGGNPPKNPPDFDEWAIFDNGVLYSQTPAPPCPDPHGFLGVNCVNDQGELGQTPLNVYEPTYLAKKAADFIRSRAADPDTPWFLYVATTVPHSPYRPEPRYARIPVPDPQMNDSNSPEADVSDKPPYVQFQRERAEAFLRSDPSTWPTGGKGADVSTDGLQGWSECIFNKIRPSQLRMLKSADDMVDQIFTTLEQTGQADETLAFYTSDHGFMWNEHGLVEKPHPYYEMRVPMLMRWPNHVTTTMDPSLVANIDMMPTALAAAGVPIPATVDGHDLLAPNRGPRELLLLERVPRWASVVSMAGDQYTEYYYPDSSPELWSDQYPVRDDSPPGTPVREYYDLRADPLQLRNLLHDGKTGDPSEARLKTLERQLADVRNCAGRGGVAGRPGSP